MKVTVGKKLTITFFAIVGIALIIAAVGYNAVNSMAAKMHLITERNWPSADAVMKASIALFEQNNAITNLVRGDLQGAQRIKRFYPKNTVTIFVVPPSLEILGERIRKRCRKTKRAEIQQRIKRARLELSAMHRYDHCLVNKDLREAVKQLKGLILNEIRRKRIV